MIATLHQIVAGKIDQNAPALESPLSGEALAAQFRKDKPTDMFLKVQWNSEDTTFSWFDSTDKERAAYKDAQGVYSVGGTAQAIYLSH